jgi:hypothetical protein
LQIVTAVAVFTSLSFFAYGGGCLFARGMKAEFDRYGLSRLRVLTGLLEIAGAVGVLIGLVVPTIGFIAASGLAMLMLGGVGVRVRIRDTFAQTLPAILYLMITLYLALSFLRAH